MGAKTVITLEKEKITIDSFGEDGMKSTKNTNLENLQQVFLNEQAIETPLLPSQWGVVKYYRKNNYEGYVLTTAPTVRTVTFDCNLESWQAEELEIPLPPLLWIFEVRAEQDGSKVLQHSMVYALKHELLSLNDNVFHAPFPNIGISHGICWGTGNPSATVAKSLQNIPARFFSQPFNFDLSNDRVQSFEYVDENDNTCLSTNAVYFIQKIGHDYLEQEDFAFPYDLLKPVGNLKVSDVVKNYLPSLL